MVSVFEFNAHGPVKSDFLQVKKAERQNHVLPPYPELVLSQQDEVIVSVNAFAS
jgi:hypothetical protein